MSIDTFIPSLSQEDMRCIAWLSLMLIGPIGTVIAIWGIGIKRKLESIDDKLFKIDNLESYLENIAANTRDAKDALDSIETRQRKEERRRYADSD